MQYFVRHMPVTNRLMIVLKVSPAVTNEGV